MDSLERQSQHPTPQEVFGLDVNNEERFYTKVLDSFGDGVTGSFSILVPETFYPLIQRGIQIDPKRLARDCMRQIQPAARPYLERDDRIAYQVLENLLVQKFTVELAEIKRSFLTSDLLGKRVEMVWREEQAQEVVPTVDEHSQLVDDVKTRLGSNEMSDRTIQYAAAMEEWVMALEGLDLAVRELQLKPGETVHQRLRLLMVSRLPENGYDRSN